MTLNELCWIGGGYSHHSSVYCSDAFDIEAAFKELNENILRVKKNVYKLSLLLTLDNWLCSVYITTKKIMILQNLRIRL